MLPFSREKIIFPTCFAPPPVSYLKLHLVFIEFFKRCLIWDPHWIAASSVAALAECDNVHCTLLCPLYTPASVFCFQYSFHHPFCLFNILCVLLANFIIRSNANSVPAEVPCTVRQSPAKIATHDTTSRLRHSH